MAKKTGVSPICCKRREKQQNARSSKVKECGNFVGVRAGSEPVICFRDTRLHVIWCSDFSGVHSETLGSRVPGQQVLVNIPPIRWRRTAGYANGVRFHSPGSRPCRAPWGYRRPMAAVTPTGLDVSARRLSEHPLIGIRHCIKTNGTDVGSFIRAKGAPRSAATLGYGM
jgi:hypothetical protein